MIEMHLMWITRHRLQMGVIHRPFGIFEFPISSPPSASEPITARASAPDLVACAIPSMST